MAITDHELDTGVSIGTQDLTGVTDIDADEAEILGHAVTYTVGDFEVPREWLMERMEDMGFPEFMRFREPTDKRAYNRVRDRLVDVDNGHDNIEVTAGGKTRKARVTTKKVDNETFQIDVDVLFDAADNEEANHGDWRNTTIGHVRYVREDGGVVTTPSIEEENALWNVWERYAAKVHEAKSYYKTVHLGKEFQKLMGRVVKHWTEGVKIRSAGAVYFVPARHADTMEQLGRLFAEIDEKFKDSGSTLEVQTIPVISDEQRRKMVAEKAEDELEARVEAAIDNIEEGLQEADPDADEDELVEDLVGVFEEELDEIDDFAAEYNALLEAELNIREVIQDRKGDVVPDAEEVIEEVGF
jgi:hypothetical protein